MAKSHAPLRRKKGTGTVIVKTGIYVLRYLDNGKVKQESTHLKATAANRSKAEEMLDRKMAVNTLLTQQEQIAVLLKEKESLQEKIARLQGLATAKLTLGGLAQAFEDSPRRKDCSPAQLDIYLQQIAAFVTWAGDKAKPVEDVDDALAEKYATYLGNNFAGGTYNKHINTLTMVWKALGKSIGVKANPWADLPRKRLESHVRRVLTDEEIAKVIKIAKGEIRDLIIIGLRTGLRLGDACRLTWESFNEDGTVEVPTSKTGAIVRLPSAALLADLGRKETSGYVIPGLADLHKRLPSTVCRRVALVFREAGITTSAKEEGWHKARPDATFHSLRHTFVTKAISAGIAAPIVRALVGHSTAAMTDRYSHIEAETVAAAFAKAGL